MPSWCFCLPACLPTCQRLAGGCPALSCCLQDEQRRAALLAPYRVAAPKRGVMGNSRYAQQLRRAVVQASRDRSR